MRGSEPSGEERVVAPVSPTSYHDAALERRFEGN